MPDAVGFVELVLLGYALRIVLVLGVVGGLIYWIVRRNRRKP